MSLCIQSLFPDGLVHALLTVFVQQRKVFNLGRIIIMRFCG